MTEPVAPELIDRTSPEQLKNEGNPAPKPPVAKEPVVLDAAAQAAADKATADAAALAEKAATDKAAEDAAKAEADKAKEGADDKELDTAVWGTTGNEQGDAVLALLQNSGVTTDEAKALLFDAVQAGDITKIDVAALEAKVGKNKATIIIAGAKNFVKEQRDAATAIVATMHTEVGGEANWKVIAEWAKEGVPAEDLDVLREMINSGGVKARLAAKEMKGLYEAADGNSTLGKTEVLPGGKPQVTTTFVPLTAVQYANQLEAANKEHRGNIPEPVRRALLDARHKGKAQGI